MTAEQPASDMDAAIGDVFSSGRDRGGNNAPPETPTAEPPATTPAAATPPPASPTENTPPESRVVPLEQHTKERDKLKGERNEERRLRMEAEARAKVLQEQFEARTQPQVQQRQPQRPDPLTDPDGYAEYVEARAEHRSFQRDLNFSETRARDKHGAPVVDEAWNAAVNAGLIGRQYFIQNSPRDPWGAMVDWHKRQKVLETVGDDPTAYEAKIRDQERQKVLAELKAGTAQPAPPQQFPGTLAAATQQGANGQNQKTLEVASADVFASDRKERGRVRK